jgi:hypothetical protein
MPRWGVQAPESMAAGLGVLHVQCRAIHGDVDGRLQVGPSFRTSVDQVVEMLRMNDELVVLSRADGVWRSRGHLFLQPGDGRQPERLGMTVDGAVVYGLGGLLALD